MTVTRDRSQVFSGACSRIGCFLLDPKCGLDAGKQCIDQKGAEEVCPVQGDIEASDSGGGKIRMGRLVHIVSREILPDRSLFGLFPDEVGDSGERGLRRAG